MELLYVWIDKYKNIEKQGFNFSPKWRFTFELEKKAFIIEDRRKDVIVDFFSKSITNVTAIVGKNGAGKTTLLQFLAEEIYSKIPYDFNQRMIALFEINQKLCFCVHDDYKWLEFNLREENVKFEYFFYKISKLNKGSSPFDRSSSWLIYYSHNYDGRIIKGNISDISTNALLEEDEEYIKKEDDTGDFNITKQSIYNHQKQELRRQIDFVLKFGNNHNQIIPFSLPNEIEIIYENKNTHRNSLKGINRKIFNTYTTTINKIEKSIENIEDNFFERFQAEFQYNLLKGLIELLWRLDSEECSKKIASIDQFFSGEKFDYPSFISAIYPSRRQMFIKTRLQSIFDLMDFVEELKEEWFSYEEASDLIYFFKLDRSNFEIVKNLLNLLTKTPDLNEMFSFSWRDLSAGERNFLNVFSRLHWCDVMEAENLVIVLDEPINSFHPQWQKEFLSKFLKTLPLVCPPADYVEKRTYQLILTTHSPFLVSDLPKENIIFLDHENGKCKVEDKPEKLKNTFGANIHYLLANGFFMQGLIGDFAKSKIDQVNDFINGKKDMDRDEADKIIEMLGEPIIKKYLKKKLEEKKHTNLITAKDAEIEKLKQEIKALKND